MVAAAGLLVWPSPEKYVTRANFHRISVSGIRSRAELLSILGPPGDYTTGPIFTDPIQETALVPSDCIFGGLSQDYWGTDDAEVTVWSTDGVTMLIYCPATRAPQGRLDNLLWRLKRQWHRWFPE
jgi:hypothetical protein